MTRLLVVVALPLTLLFSLANAQQNLPSDETVAVRTTVVNYIEGYFTGNSRRMEQTLHPHYLKHVIHGEIPMREETRAQLMTEVREIGVPDLPAAGKTEQVIVLDVAGRIASAKLITPGWTDYIALEKVNGEWKILSVIQRIDN